MRLRVALMLSCFFPICASAHDWVEISADADSAFYFDRASLARAGAIVEVLLLWNFPDMQLTRAPVKPYMSATRLTRFDCEAGRRASMVTTLYRGPMASGEVSEVYRTPEAELRFEWVNPEAPGGESMRRVCASGKP